ncbi:polysaccharide pyruvyl transferase family protein [Pseudarthrobacter oxydans]|uniref:polysaccharide pyruvyl transferase family protein n=1 Tax=Pseudarthrobacter oxydans TaxID=1671 RepID=UPI0038144785
MASEGSPKELRVLVLWADGKSPNLGVQVLGAGAASVARSVWGPDATINLQDFAGTQTGVGMGIKAITKEFLTRKNTIRSFLKSHDFVLDTGAGDSFTDIYGFKRMITIFVIQRWCLRQGVPVVLLPQTIGPFNSALGRFMARRQLAELSLVMTRDPKSAEVSEQLGRTPEVASSDLVFALQEEEAKHSYDILLNVSGLLWNPNKHVDCEKYRVSVRSFIVMMNSEGRRVTLLAHVVDGAPGDNDSAAIADLMGDRSLKIDAVIPDSLAHARQVIAGSNLVVGARMHACLNALSLGVPSIPWAYSRKFEPLLAQLGWTHFVDLKAAESVSQATAEILASTHEDVLRSSAAEVAEAGRAALSLTVDGIRNYRA